MEKGSLLHSQQIKIHIVVLLIKMCNVVGGYKHFRRTWVLNFAWNTSHKSGWLYSLLHLGPPFKFSNRSFVSISHTSRIWHILRPTQSPWSEIITSSKSRITLQLLFPHAPKYFPMYLIHSHSPFPSLTWKYKRPTQALKSEWFHMIPLHIFLFKFKNSF